MEKTKVEKADDFDDILNMLGLGKWNMLVFLVLGFIGFMCPCFVLATVFIAPTLNFDCDLSNITENIMSQDKCTYSTVKPSEFESLSDLKQNLSSLSLVPNWTEAVTEKDCDAWTYNSSEYTNTVTSEFNLVCDYAYVRPTYQTIFMVANLVGAPLNGFLSDRYGRKLLLVITSVISVSSVLLSTLSPQIILLLVLRVFTGLTTIPSIQTAYILSLEVCEPKHRSTAGILLGLPWAFGTMWWGALAFLIRDWRWLMRASALPALPLFLALYVMTESPRWLIVEGQHRRALRTIKTAAKWNRSPLPPDDELLRKMIVVQKNSAKHLSETSTKSSGVISSLRKVVTQIVLLYKTPEIRRRTLLVYVVFFVSGTVFYGISFSAVNFQLNPYMYMVVGGLFEIPAYSLILPAVIKFGRVPPMATFYFLCGVSILAITFIPSDGSWLWLVTCMAMVGKFSISAAYQVIYLVATEVYPTEVRMQGLGTSSFISSTGGAIAPFITDLIGTWRAWAPSTIFGVLCIVAGAASIFIPETLNKHLPETVKELESQRRNKNAKECVEEAEIANLNQ